MMEEQNPANSKQPKPSIRARLSILLIGGVAIAGIVLMCVLVLVFATRS